MIAKTKKIVREPETAILSCTSPTMRRRSGPRRFSWLAQDIAILFAMKTIKAISWVHKTVQVGVRRLSDKAA